ncbi:MAG TPA: outer membrane beta-barrel protein, partial [Chitinophagaceae bacterium]|nr:outer membrane beta-barrel protein [Chitinophagaceae bacterium]
MNRSIFSVIIAAGYFLVQACVPQKHANTIVRDEENPCIIRIVVQLGIDGTDDDVAAVTTQMEDCFKKECFIPCETDKEKGCKVTMNAIVKKWSSLSGEEKETFHQINMVPNDGLPSNAHIGKANSGNSFGTWRRNEHPHAYCHETMHLLGLPDKYCSRLYNAVDGSAILEVSCDPPPDPNGNCCVPDAQNTRCGTPCGGHDHDLMATVAADLSCENIMDVLKLAGFDKCPDECCLSAQTFRSSLFGGPSYLHFGDQNTKFDGFGATLNYTYPLGKKVGLTIDGGYYMHIDKQGDFKESNNIFTLHGGISYNPKFFGSGSKLGLSTHALLGIANWKTKVEFPGGENKESETSFSANLGASLDYKLNSKFDLRLLQVDYIPTFFREDTQNNYRVSVG